MESARAAFANAEGLTDVRVASVPGMRELLQVRAPVDHDWEQTAARVAPQQWWFEAFRADDVVANLRQELAKELAVAPRDVAARQRAWTTFGRLEPRFCAERIVLGALEQLVAGRASMWDPRLDEVAAASVALRQFWTAVAPALEPAVLPALARDAQPVAPWTECVREALTRVPTAAADGELAAERRFVTPAPSRWWTMQFVCRRVAQQCAAVQEHAQRLAERTRDVGRRAAYAELARRCADIVGALELLTQ